MVVMKLDVNWSSAKRSRRQDLPTPGRGVGRERGEHGDPIGRSESVCVASAPLSISLTAVPNQQQLDQVVVVRALGGGRHGCGVCVEEAGREAGAARKTRGERIRGEKPASERGAFPHLRPKRKKKKKWLPPRADTHRPVAPGVRACVRVPSTHTRAHTVPLIVSMAGVPPPRPGPPGARARGEPAAPLATKPTATPPAPPRPRREERGEGEARPALGSAQMRPSSPGTVVGEPVARNGSGSPAVAWPDRGPRADPDPPSASPSTSSSSVDDDDGGGDGGGDSAPGDGMAWWTARLAVSSATDLPAWARPRPGAGPAVKVSRV